MCVKSDALVIVGYPPGSSAVRTPIANLKVATFDGHALRNVGAVGTYAITDMADLNHVNMTNAVTLCPTTRKRF